MDDKTRDYLDRWFVALRNDIAEMKKAVLEIKETSTKIFYECLECGEDVAALTVHIDTHHAELVLSLQCPKCKKYTIYDTDQSTSYPSTQPY